MIKRLAVLAAAIGLCLPVNAFARDSARYVCSAVASFRAEGADTQIGISIDFFDSRAEGGNARKYVLSSIYQGKLFQGSMIDRSDKFGEGSVSLKSGKSELYVGKFKLEAENDNNYAMAIDGKINDDPNSGKKLYPITAKLPCVNLSI
jgi:hypothetical protein